MGEGQGVYECMRCDRKISKEEYETYGGLCEECHEIEITNSIMRMNMIIDICGSVIASKLRL